MSDFDLCTEPTVGLAVTPFLSFLETDVGT